MDFPQLLSLKVLESTHSDYAAIAPALIKINDLAAGGWRLEAKKEQYLKPRPGEEPDLYKLRLEKFTYTNVLGGAISQQASKLSSGSLSITGLDAHTEFWQKFRENNNRKGRSEKALLAEIFRQGLKFQKVFLHVEKPYQEAVPKTRQQEEALGLLPYVCCYSPLEVINWSEGAFGWEWLKVRQLSAVSSPFGKSKTKAVWTYITPTHVAKYEALVKLGKNGAIAEIINEKGESLDSGEEARVSLARNVAHGIGQLPVICLELPEDLWVTDQAYLKAMEHLRLENSRSDTAEMVGYVQRTWRPHVTPDNDLDHTFVDSNEELKTGNQYVIKGDFGFSEASGTSLASVGSVLQEIRDVIEDLIGMARSSGSRGAMQQSGLSKKMDFVVQELVLKAYGTILVDTYQDLLQLVGKVAGYSSAETEKISVTGLDSFDVDSLESALAIAIELVQVEDRLPTTVLKLFYQGLSNLLVKNASAEQQQQIKDELEKVFGHTVQVQDLIRDRQIEELEQPLPLPEAA